MTDRFTDAAGNEIGHRDHVVIRATGQVCRVVAIDRYRDQPIQVRVGWTGTNRTTAGEYRWCAPWCLLVVPDRQPGPEVMAGVTVADKLPSGDWVS